MTRLFVTGQIDWWNAFWIFSTWAAAYMIAAVYLREKFGAPQTLFEKYWLWFGRVVGVVGASIIFAYGYRATGELERVEHECERYKALAAKHASGVSDPTFVALRSAKLRNGLTVEWECGDDGRTRPVSVARGRSSAGRDRIQSSLTDTDGQSGSPDSMPRGTPGVTTGTNGDDETF